MPRFVFASIINPTKRFAIYESYSDNPAHSWRNTFVLSDYLATFDTLGDGETQHTAESCPPNTFESAEDLVMSAIHVLSDMPTGDSSIANNFHRTIVPYSMPSPKLLTFIGSLKWDANKTVYVNFDECKKSTADSKRHDKRWTQLESTYDGSVNAFRRGLYDADISRGNCIHAILRDLAIWNHLDKPTWSLASSLTKESGSVFSGVDDDRLERFIGGVASLRDYLDARSNMESTLASLIRRADNFTHRLRHVEA